MVLMRRGRKEEAPRGAPRRGLETAKDMCLCPCVIVSCVCRVVSVDR